MVAIGTSCSTTSQHNMMLNSSISISNSILFIFDFHILSLLFRLTLAMCSLLKAGRTTAWGYLITWPPSIGFCPSSGSQRYGGRTHFSKMPRVSISKLWRSLTTTFGYGRTRQFSTWSSKKRNYVFWLGEFIAVFLTAFFCWYSFIISH